MPSPFKANSIRRAFSHAIPKRYPFGISKHWPRNSWCSTEILFKTRYMLAKPKKNVALSVHGDTFPYSVKAVKVCTLPDTVDIKSHLMDRTTRLKHFFTTQSKIAPCISYSQISPQFWKTIHNNNRSNERRIGRLKNIENDKLGDESSQMNKTDMRLRAFLYNMELD